MSSVLQPHRQGEKPQDVTKTEFTTSIGEIAAECCMVARHDDNPIDLTEDDEEGDGSSAEEDEQGE